MKWTVDNMCDLSGSTVVVTGANSGIGFDAARVCASSGAHTILACRNEGKGTEAAAAVAGGNPEGSVEYRRLDLASLASVREFSKSLLSSFDRIDVLVNNAGIMMTPYERTEDGFEGQFGVNHLGHFALTGLLLPALLAAPAARVVNISSFGHYMGWINFNNLMFEGGKGYHPVTAYSRSKLANLLFTRELQRRFNSSGSNAMALAAHPGAARTNLARYVEERWYLRPFVPLGLEYVAQPSAMGALPTLRAIADPDVRGGEYFGPRGPFEVRGYPVKVGSSPLVRNRKTAERLWSVSEQLTGVKYSWPRR